jgi:hypothetical protein
MKIQEIFVMARTESTRCTTELYWLFTRMKLFVQNLKYSKQCRFSHSIPNYSYLFYGLSLHTLVHKLCEKISFGLMLVLYSTIFITNVRITFVTKNWAAGAIAEQLFELIVSLFMKIHILKTKILILYAICSDNDTVSSKFI